jgi:hypothetical protein
MPKDAPINARFSLVRGIRTRRVGVGMVRKVLDVNQTVKKIQEIVQIKRSSPSDS